MSRLILFFIILILFTSCIGQHKSDAQKTKIAKENLMLNLSNVDTLTVDLSNSSIFWKGTKMRGVGKHEGILQLQSAYFLSKNEQIIGGQFVADMTTIGVTDIPEHESIPIKRLNDHLKSEDFFGVEKYPFSKFTITKIQNLLNNHILVSGNLTIKDVTKSIEFKAVNNRKKFSTKFTFDRVQWNVAYEGSWADKTLVDRDVELAIELKIK